MESGCTNYFQKGTFFPSSSSATLCFTKTKPISNIQLERLKREILDYLKIHDKASISDLSNLLKVEPKKIVLAISELKKEGLII